MEGLGRTAGEEVSIHPHLALLPVAGVCLCTWGWLRDWRVIHAAHKQRELVEDVTGGQRCRGWETANPDKANHLFPKDVCVVPSWVRSRERLFNTFSGITLSSLNEKSELSSIESSMKPLQHARRW